MACLVRHLGKKIPNNPVIFFESVPKSTGVVSSTIYIVWRGCVTLAFLTSILNRGNITNVIRLFFNHPICQDLRLTFLFLILMTNFDAWLSSFVGKKLGCFIFGHFYLKRGTLGPRIYILATTLAFFIVSL